MIPSFTDAPAGALVLLGLSLLLVASSVVLFARRDIGRAAFVWQRTSANGKHQAERSLSRAERAVSTRAVSLRSLAASGWSSFWWLLGMMAFCAAILYITPSFQKPFYNAVQQTPGWPNFFSTLLLIPTPVCWVPSSSRSCQGWS